MPRNLVSYNAIARLLECGVTERFDNATIIMALLGYEVSEHKRLRLACRPVGESAWQSLPDFRSADDAALWLRSCSDGWFGTVEQTPRGKWNVWFHKKDGRLGRGSHKTLGIAMWAAFIRSNRPEKSKP